MQPTARVRRFTLRRGRLRTPHRRQLNRHDEALEIGVVLLISSAIWLAQRLTPRRGVETRTQIHDRGGY